MSRKLAATYSVVAKPWLKCLDSVIFRFSSAGMGSPVL